MATAKVLEQPRPVVMAMPLRDLLRLIATGALIGLVTYALYVVLDRYVFTPALCGNGVGFPERCGSKEYFASTLAMLLGAMCGIFVFVQQRVYRPLLVIILATLALWNIFTVGSAATWWLFALIVLVIFALTYAAFAWIVQIRNLYVALGISVLLLVVVRLLMGS
ncbi:MAG TPA: hypothetical protein VGE34_02165 [Candidatus Saccharimonadales bacterium]